MECIQCGRCEDACHGIMTSLKRPTGLIRTTSELALNGQTARRFRWRPMIYLALLLIDIGVVAFSMESRPDLDLTILRQTGSTYSLIDQAHYGNYFIMRVVNQSHEDRQLLVEFPAEIRVVCSLCGQTIEADHERKGNLVLIVPRSSNFQSVPVKIGERTIDLPLLKP